MKTKEQHNLYMKEYHQKNREKLNKYIRAHRLKRKYGLTETQYEETLASQGGGCALCGKPPLNYKLAVDHDHVTGKIRGILCFSCNRGLGSLGDNIEGLNRAIQYLTRSLDS